MLIGGITAVYFDWYRRIALEAACECEPKALIKYENRERMAKNILLRDETIKSNSH